MSEDDIPSHRLFGDEPTGPHDALPPEVPGYVTERCIGEGASASVWLVRQERPFMRTAAMKVYRASSGGGAILGRFRSERDILARLPTTGFCALYDAGLCADGRPFICMEFIDGPNMLEACRAPGMYASRIGTLFLALLRTVAHAHSLGLIHLDLKPSNVLVVPAGEPGAVGVPKVIDFGLSVREGDRSLGTGTRGYAAPEVVEGRIASKSADVYSIATMFERALREAPGCVDTALGRRLLALAVAQRADDAARRAVDAGAFAELLAHELGADRPGRRRALAVAAGVVFAAAAGSVGAYRWLRTDQRGSRTQRIDGWACIDLVTSYNAGRSMLHDGDRLPWGVQRIAGVPFILGLDPSIDDRMAALCVWSASVGHGDNPRVLAIPVPADGGIPATEVALLLSTLWGRTGVEMVFVDLVSAGGARRSTALRAGRDVRDYRGGTLDGGACAAPGIEYAPGQWLDIQRIRVPNDAEFGTLAEVRVRDEGQSGISRALCFGCAVGMG